MHSTSQLEKIFLLFLLFNIPNFLFAQNKKKKQLIEIEKRRFQAMINKDSVFLTSFLSNDLIYIHSNGDTDSKGSLIKRIIHDDIIYHSIQVKSMNVTIKGKTGWINGLAYVKVKPVGSNVMDIIISYLDVYHFTKKQWQLQAWQSAKIN